MRPKPERPRAGQESVWAYPRPAVAAANSAHLAIRHRGVVVADSRRAIRTLETSHPPSYYFPRDDIAPGGAFGFQRGLQVFLRQASLDKRINWIADLRFEV